ncbi:MAG TPA: tRNA (adenosine(37)-N6)-threonylcarbamoyltransferase complex ATPase subunit type 1 TsaE [Candidatus Kapabacteria bacterium]|nr:tRNA (adenosine(37)-N6)-threonylcarbamoyltransferase complex ATPase subunit type 1 TsaE [Candidatus Kapabacteria bacterium]
MDTEIYSSFAEEETYRLGEAFASRLRGGDIVAFYGDLGAGKTEFIKGICQGMNVEEIVASPTYTIVNQYVGTDADDEEVSIYHIDLYRIEKSEELIEVGLTDLLADRHSIKLIEWAENAEPVLPKVRYDVIVTALDDENQRRIEIIFRDGLAMSGVRTHAYSW